MTKPNDTMLLKANLKQLRLPTIGAEFEKLAREATASNQTFEQYLLRLTELEVATRQANALTSRIRQAKFPVEKGLENFDFSASKTVNKQKVLELARGEWITQRSNVCLLGQPGTGKPRPSEYTAGHRDLRGRGLGHRSVPSALWANAAVAGIRAAAGIPPVLPS